MAMPGLKNLGILVNEISVESSLPTVPNNNIFICFDSSNNGNQLVSMNNQKIIDENRKSLKTYLLTMPKSLITAFGLAILVGISVAIAVPVVCLTEPKNTNVSTTSNSSTGTIDLSSFRWSEKGISVAGVSNDHGDDSRRLSFCTGISLDSLNTLYIADYENNRIQKKQLGSSNSTTIIGENNELNYPGGVIIDSSGNLYVVDTGNHKVHLWTQNSLSGTIIAGTGFRGSNTNELNTPWDIALRTNSNIFYVSDQYNNRIVEYQLGILNGTVIAGGNGPGKNLNQLFCPRGITFDSLTNSILISNFGGNNILQWIIGYDHWIIIAGSSHGELGSTSQLLHYPSDIFIDTSKNLYVADTYNHRIQFFLNGQTNGTTIAGKTTKPDSTPNSLNYPHSIQLDKQLHLYVADAGNYRIQKFIRY